MSRIVLTLGVLIDGLLGGISFLGREESCWWITALAAGLSILSPLAILLARIIAESFDQPDVVALPSTPAAN